MRAWIDRVTKPLVSVVIPTRNAGPQFAGTLDAINSQAGNLRREIVVIDSGSTDGTPDLAARAGARVVPVAPEQFSHGGTRNEGIRCSRGEYVVLLVQDALPADDHWLIALFDALHGDRRVAGVYSRHTGRPEHDYLSRYVAEYWHRHAGGRRVQEIGDPAAFAALPWGEQRDHYTFNNVSSAIRRSVWRRYPFPAIPYAEDVAWAKTVLEAGYRIVYEPASVVRHSHVRPAEYELRRTFVDARTSAGIFARPGQPLSREQAQDLLRYFAGESDLARGDLDRPAVDPELMALVDEFCQGEEWYRAHFDLLALRRLFGPAAPWTEADRRYLDDKLDWHESRHRDPRQAGIDDPVEPEAAEPPAPARGDGQAEPVPPTEPVEPAPPISARIKAAVNGAAISREDLDFTFADLWHNLGRDFARQGVLDSLADRPLCPTDEVIREQRSFCEQVLQGAAEAGELTQPLFWRVRLCAAAWAIGRWLGQASTAPRSDRDAAFWRDLADRWSVGI